MASKQVLHQVIHKPTGAVSSIWGLPEFLDYLEYLNHDLRAPPSIDTSKTGFLDLIIRGDGVPVEGCTWMQLSIGFAHFGRLSRMLTYLWTMGVGVVPESDIVSLAWLWRVNLRWIQKFLDEGTMNYCGTTYPTRFFCWENSPWLRHELGITTNWMVASLYNFGICYD